MKYIHRPRTRLDSKKKWRKIRTWTAVLLMLALIAWWLIQSFHIDLRFHAYAPTIKKAEAAKSTTAKNMPIQLKYLNPQQQVNWEIFVQNAKAIAPAFDFPVKVLLAQAALESGHGTSNIAVQKNNWFGMNAIDSDPNQAFAYPNSIQSMIDYMIRVRDNYTDAYAARNNPDRMIELLEENSQGLRYATDGSYVEKLRSLPEWRQY
jgi:flagellum-specific peptidoglycan hydrolase FlgJ